MSKSTELNIKVGNDVGNSEHDIVINGKIITQPNVFSTTKELPNLDDVKPSYVVDHIENNLITTVNSPACPPSIYYIGDMALKSGKPVSSMEVGLLNDKVNSDIVIVNTLAQIAGYAVQNSYTNNPDSINTQIIATVDMTISLPVTQYNRSSADKLAQKFLSGKHNVIVHIGDIRADVDIIFEFVKVLPESVPVIFALKTMSGEIFEEFNKLYNQNISGDYFSNKRVLHVAIGEGTTEYPITQDIEFDPNFIRGSNNGIGLAIESAMEKFLPDVHLRSYSRQNYSVALRDPAHKYHSKAQMHIEEPLNVESEEILRIVKAEIEKANNEVDIICIHGGGSILMKPTLYNKLMNLCKITDIKMFYVPEKFAVILEAEGLYEFVNCDIFNSLKMNVTGKEPLKI